MAGIAAAAPCRWFSFMSLSPMVPDCRRLQISPGPTDTLSRRPGTTLTLEGDVAATTLIIAQQKTPWCWSHSYGGAVIAEAGNDPQGCRLVYIRRGWPDKGESLGSLLHTVGRNTPSAPPPHPRSCRARCFLMVDREKFCAFAGDVDPEPARFMADAQVPWNVAAAGGAKTNPAGQQNLILYRVTTETI